MIIYKAEKKDMIDLCDMWFKLQTCHKGLAAYMQEVEDWRVKKEKELLLVLESSKTQVFIARDEIRAVGYVRGSVKDMSPVFVKARVGSIDELFIIEEFRGRGAGKNLVEYMKMWFRNKGVSEVNLHVSSDNERAKDFWCRRGFADTSVRMTAKL